MEGCGIRLVQREGDPLCLLKLCWFDFFFFLFFSSELPVALRAGAAGRRAGREPGAGTLRRARCPLALPGCWAARRGPFPPKPGPT